MEKNQTLNITIQFGIPKNQQLTVANIFYENFQDKFKIFLGNKKKAIPLIASTLEDDRIIVAIKDRKVIRDMKPSFLGEKKYLNPIKLSTDKFFTLKSS